MIFVRDIQREVAAHYSLPVGIMTGQTRIRDHAWPRQEAMALAARLTEQSLVNIGRLFGNRDHTTVIHAIRRVGKRDDDATRLMMRKVTLQLLRDGQ